MGEYINVMRKKRVYVVSMWHHWTEDCQHGGWEVLKVFETEEAARRYVNSALESAFLIEEVEGVGF